MATKTIIVSPGGSLETTVEDTGGVILSSFVVALTFDAATNTINDNGTTRKVKKSEVIQCMRIIEQFLEKDPNSDFG